MPSRKQQLKALAKQDEKQRAKTARKTRSEVVVLLVNPDGLDRLRAISDEEWEKVVTASQGDESA